MSDEREIISLAVADLFAQWAQVEDHLCHVLCVSMFPGTDEHHNRLASAIYFTPSGLQGRIAIVSAVVEEFASQLPEPDRFRAVWIRHKERLRRQIAIRDRVAHGSIRPLDKRDGALSDYRLIAPLYDYSRRESQQPLAAGQLAESARIVGELSSVTRFFRNSIAQCKHNRDEFPSEILRLEARIL